MPIVHAISGNDSKHFTFTDFFPNRANNFILMTETFDHLPTFTAINRSILQQVLSLNLVQNPAIADGELQEFFRQLNWQINANLKRIPIDAEGKSLETGISLLFAWFREDCVTVVQFGRILCGIISEENKIELGHGWDNFSIKSREALNLLGFVDDNIPVKLHHHKLEPGEFFVAFSSIFAGKVSQTQMKPRLWKLMFEEMKGDSAFLHCLVENPPAYVYRPFYISWLKPFRITAAVLSVVIVATIAYWFFGRNQFETQLVTLKGALPGDRTQSGSAESTRATWRPHPVHVSQPRIPHVSMRSRSTSARHWN